MRSPAAGARQQGLEILAFVFYYRLIGQLSGWLDSSRLSAYLPAEVVSSAVNAPACPPRRPRAETTRRRTVRSIDPHCRAFRGRLIAIAAAAFLTITTPGSPAAEFYAIESVESSTAADDFYPVENLISGPGEGFTADEPHDQLLVSGPESLWVTDACGFPCDYIETSGLPVLKIDLGEDRQLSEISVWGYSQTNSNGVRDFSLRFATDADGPDGFGTSIDKNPVFEDVQLDTVPRQSFRYETVNARYVEFTALDNYFEAPGDGSGGEIPGGDRVGLGEIAFEIIDGVFVAGDFNSDGLIDLQDFEILSGNLNTSDADFADGDINFDSRVDLQDFVQFRDIYAGATAATAAVPEPATAGLMLLGLLSLVGARRFSARRSEQT
jgi:hypothetical protein